MATTKTRRDGLQQATQVPPTDATLTKAERNAVQQLLGKLGFDPSDFVWKEVLSEEPAIFGGVMSTGNTEFNASQIVHCLTRYYFTFGGYTVISSPGDSKKVAQESHGDSWKSKSEWFEVWLKRLREEVDAPDLWTTIGQERMLSNAASSTSDNNPFTPSEQSMVAAQLDELKQHLLAGQQFQAEQTEFIEEQFTYLKGASERLGRKDWLNTALGGFVGLIVGLALDPEKAKALLAVAGTLFRWVWTGAQGLLR